MPLSPLVESSSTEKTGILCVTYIPDHCQQQSTVSQERLVLFWCEKGELRLGELAPSCHCVLGGEAGLFSGGDIEVTGTQLPHGP